MLAIAAGFSSNGNLQQDWRRSLNYAVRDRHHYRLSLSERGFSPNTAHAVNNSGVLSLRIKLPTA